MTVGDFICPPQFGCEKFVAQPDPVLDRELWQVDELNFGVRALNLFQNVGIQTLRDLTQTSARRLLLARQCGRKTVAKIRTELAKLGLELVK
jgi:DNA-directed RNA polymerase alpha subunit